MSNRAAELKCLDYKESWHLTGPQQTQTFQKEMNVFAGRVSCGARGGFHTSSRAKCSLTWPGFSLPVSGGFPVCAFPWRPPQPCTEPAGKNGLVGLAGRAQLGKSRIHSCSKAINNALSASQKQEAPTEGPHSSKAPFLHPFTCRPFLGTEQDRMPKRAL